MTLFMFAQSSDPLDRSSTMIQHGSSRATIENYQMSGKASPDLFKPARTRRICCSFGRWLVSSGSGSSWIFGLTGPPSNKRPSPALLLAYIKTLLSLEPWYVNLLSVLSESAAMFLKCPRAKRKIVLTVVGPSLPRSDKATRNWSLMHHDVTMGLTQWSDCPRMSDLGVVWQKA
jgi:hypothetical protein